MLLVPDHVDDLDRMKNPIGNPNQITEAKKGSVSKETLGSMALSEKTKASCAVKPEITKNNQFGIIIERGPVAVAFLLHALRTAGASDAEIDQTLARLEQFAALRAF
jgi:hypothetical protein